LGVNIRVAIGADHAGISHKNEITKALIGMDHEVKDYGTDTQESVDYPDYAKKVAEAVASGDQDKGVLICGTGIGMSITANRIKGVRAALCCSVDAALMAREHNDANILCLGARTQDIKDCIKITDVFFNTPFTGKKRHSKRIKKMG